MFRIAVATIQHKRLILTLAAQKASARTGDRLYKYTADGSKYLSNEYLAEIVLIIPYVENFQPSLH